MNSLDKMEDYDRLARLCEAKDAEIAELLRKLALKHVDGIELAKIHGEGFATAVAHLCALRKQDIDNLRVQLSEAQAQIAMLAEALEDLLFAYENYSDIHTESVSQASAAISATSETVAAWIAKKTEPLRMEVATLVEQIELIGAELDVGGIESAKKLCLNINSDLQATALAYERKVKAKVLEDAAEWFESAPEVNAFRIRDILKKQSADLRA